MNEISVGAQGAGNGAVVFASDSSAVKFGAKKRWGKRGKSLRFASREKRRAKGKRKREFGLFDAMDCHKRIVDSLSGDQVETVRLLKEVKGIPIPLVYVIDSNLGGLVKSLTKWSSKEVADVAKDIVAKWGAAFTKSIGEMKEIIAEDQKRTKEAKVAKAGSKAAKRGRYGPTPQSSSSESEDEEDDEINERNQHCAKVRKSIVLQGGRKLRTVADVREYLMSKGKLTDNGTAPADGPAVTIVKKE